MAKTPAQSALDSLIGATMLPALRPLGFKKDARTFRRTAPGSIAVVNAQVSQWSSRDSLQFTLNLGVYFPGVQKALEGYFRAHFGRSGPREVDCHVRERLGFLLGGADIWWDVTAGKSSASVEDELKDALVTFGIPWLERMTDVEEARRFVEPRSGIHSLGFLLLQGKAERAKQVLRGMLEENPALDDLRAWGVRAGLLS